MYRDFNIISGSVMAFIYAACGLLLLVFETPYLRLPDDFKIILGLALISYAGFRLFRVYRSYSLSEKENGNEDENT